MTDPTAPALTPIRPGHEFDVEALRAWLTAAGTGLAGELEVLQFEGGQSNPTFLLRSAAGEWVLRKQPPGELLPSAHQVDREYRVMDALATTPVPVPRMIARCDDVSVLGVKFYVMEKVEGRVLTDITLPTCPPADRRAIYEDLARVLARLHRIDPAAVGLADFGRPGNYYERQIGRWTRQYRASQTETLPDMDRLIEWLPAHTPDTDESVVVHGDYRLGNVIIDPDAPRIAAVLDWELATLGHPLADLAYLCMDYHCESYDGGTLARDDLTELGIPTERQLIEVYCREAGREPPSEWNFYMAYNLFRSAAISQGVYRRGLDGNASSEAALAFESRCRTRAAAAVALLDAA